MAVGQVLLVDDDRALRDAVGRALRLEGFDVTLASDGPEALELALKSPPDIVVLDVAMPSMSGVEVCRRMRAHGRADVGADADGEGWDFATACGSRRGRG